jgi:hypothetical protein
MSATLKKPDPVHEGKTWRDMPGSTPTNQRLNFALWKRGKFQLPSAKVSEAMSIWSRQQRVYATDSEELMMRLTHVRAQRDLTIYGVAMLIHRTTDEVSFGPLFRQLREIKPMSEKVAGVVREWLRNQPEEAAEEVAA